MKAREITPEHVLEELRPPYLMMVATSGANPHDDVATRDQQQAALRDELEAMGVTADQFRCVAIGAAWVAHGTICNGIPAPLPTVHEVVRLLELLS